MWSLPSSVFLSHLPRRHLHACPHLLARHLDRASGSITLFHRMGIGIVISALSIVVADLVEENKRSSAIIHGRPILVLWVALMGVVEVFNTIMWLLLFPCCKYESRGVNGSGLTRDPIPT
ncbi:hypothetical protein ACLOJK_024444 [Asimina triloba]